MFGGHVGTGTAERTEQPITFVSGVHRPGRRGGAAALLALLFGSFLQVATAPALAQSVKDAYLLDARGEVVRNTAFGDAKVGNLCWRTGYWTPALAISQCDPDIAVRTAPAPRKPPVPPAAKSPAR